MAGTAGLLLGALMLGPALAPGFVLTYDMVFVPDPPANAQLLGLTGGFPRPVPSDAVVAALAAVLPAQLVQKLVLLAAFVLAACGVARLVPGPARLPRLAAAVFYGWNPFVAERLLLGHWALLLGYAGLPWIALALVSDAPPRRAAAGLARALVPAAIGGFAAMNISLLTVAGLLATRPGRRRERGERRENERRRGVTAPIVLALLAGMSLPWLVPALSRLGTPYGSGGPDPAGIALFAARADTPFGTFGSLLSLGGIWNGEVVPPGYDNPIGAGGRLLLGCLAIGAYGWLLARPAGTGGAAEPARRRMYAGLAMSAAAGLAIACLGVTGPGRELMQWLAGAWPGFGALRDAQLYVAPLALLEAIGIGALTSMLLRPVTTGRAAEVIGPAGPSGPAAPAADPGGVALAWLVAIAPVALLPALAWGMAGRLDAVSYPADWGRARTIIAADRVPGAVLSLPWAAHRRPAWNGRRTVLDPAPRMFPRRVVWNDALRVGGRETVAEDPKARAAADLLRSPGRLTPMLAGAGYRYVVVDASAGREAGTLGSDQAELRSRLAGAVRVHAGPALTVYRIDRPAGFRENRPSPQVSAIGGLITLLLTLWSFGAPGSSLIPLRHTRQ